MATRASWGLRKDGVLKETYVHYDGYPTGLGFTIAKFLEIAKREGREFEDRDDTQERLTEVFNRIRVLKFDDEATERDIGKYLKYADTSVSSRDIKDYYTLLRLLQGKPEEYILNKELDVMYPNNGDNEWRYIIDINEMNLYIEDCYYSRMYRIPVMQSRLDMENYLTDIENGELQ